MLVFGHRGASKEFPENTMLSFKRAAELGVDYIETDIHFTKDNRFAVIHDSTIDRVTDGKGKVDSYSMGELKKFDAAYSFTRDGGLTYPYRGKGQKIMSLEELLDAFPGQRFNIDLKDKNALQVKYFADIIDKFYAHGRIIVYSIHHKNLKELRRICPEVNTAFSATEILTAYFLFKCGLLFLNFLFKGTAFQIPEQMGEFRLATKSFVKELHAIGIDVHIWTVNHEKDMRRFIDMGVDGLMTDDPALLIDVINKMT